MRELRNRRRLAHALRASWRILRLTLAPPHGSAPVASAPPPAEPSEPVASTVSPTEAAPENREKAGNFGHFTVAGASAPTLHAPAPAECDPLPRAAAPTSAPASDSAFDLLNARLDLVSQRLDLLRDQLMLRTSVTTAVTSPSTAVLDELRALRDRLDLVERRGARADDLSRAALRPPRVPTGLDVMEPMGPVVSGSTEWDFVDATGMGPRLTGTFQDLRLPTLLELLQLERRVGILVLRTPEHTLELDLRRGSVVGVRLDGTPADVVAAVREAFRWPTAEFTFRKSELVMDSGVPQSIHGLLLEVLRQNDEASRAG